MFHQKVTKKSRIYHKKYHCFVDEVSIWDLVCFAECFQCYLEMCQWWESKTKTWWISSIQEQPIKWQCQLFGNDCAIATVTVAALLVLRPIFGSFWLWMTGWRWMPDVQLADGPRIYHKTRENNFMFEVRSQIHRSIDESRISCHAIFSDRHKDAAKTTSSIANRKSVQDR